MRKIGIITFAFGMLLGFVACSNSDQNDLDENTSEDNQTEEVEQTEENQETEEEIEDTTNNEAENPDIADYEEASVITDQIDLDGLEAEIETDNQNKRILLFLDGNAAIYKTIYIKHDKRLKIIDIDDNEGQIYNEIIK